MEKNKKKDLPPRQDDKHHDSEDDLEIQDQQISDEDVTDEEEVVDNFKDDVSSSDLFALAKSVKPLNRNGTNFHLWVTNTLADFAILGLDVFTRSRDIAERHKTSRKHAAFMSAVRKALHDDHATMLIDVDNAYDLWHKVLTLFRPKSVLTKVSLIHKLSALSRSYKGDGIDKHFSQIDDLFRDLSGVGLQLDEQLRTAIVLGSMPASFDMVISSLSSRESIDDGTARAFLKDFETRTEMGKQASRSAAHTSPSIAAVALAATQKHHGRVSACKRCGGRHHPSQQCVSNRTNERDSRSSGKSTHRSSGSANSYADYHDDSRRPFDTPWRKFNHQPSQPRTSGKFSKSRSAYWAGTDPIHDEEKESPVSDIDWDTFSNSSLSSSSSSVQAHLTERQSSNEHTVSMATTVVGSQFVDSELPTLPEALFTADTQSTPGLFSLVVDSGATDHFICQKELFQSFETTPDKAVGVANGKRIYATGKGTARLKVRHEGQDLFFTLEDALFVPAMVKSLLSVGKLSDDFTIMFKKRVCYLSEPGKSPLPIPISVTSNLFEVTVEPVPCQALAASPVDINIAHKRLGHINLDYVRKVASENVGLTLLPSSKPTLCDGCMIGKSTKLPVPAESFTRAPAPGLLLHADVCGDFNTISIARSSYYLIIVDDYSRSIFLFPLVAKSDTAGHIINTINFIKTSLGTSVKVLRTDRGGEFSSKELASFLSSRGIVHQQPPAESSSQNGVSERSIRTVSGLTRSMIYSSGLPAYLWSEFALTAAFVLNRSPLRAIGGRFPLELWSGMKPDISKLRAIGCIAFAHLTDRERNKVGAQAVECYLVGYEPNTKDGYRLWCPSKRSIIVSRDVRFFESIMYRDRNKVDHETLLQLAWPQPAAADKSVKSDIRDAKPMSEPAHGADLPLASVPADPAKQLARNDLLSTRPQRTRKFTVPHWHMAQTAQAMLVEFTSDREPDVSVFLAAQSATIHITPRSFKEAMSLPNHAEWKAAFDAEYNAIQKAGTWELVPLPPGRKALGTTWVCKVKTHADGTVDKLKSRLVAQGYSQVLGIDFIATFAPVAKLSTIRLIFALAAALDMVIHHVDVDSAFLNGELEEEVYVKQPEGYVVPGKEHLVCRLRKSLYGLKQAGKVWYEHLRNALVTSGFQACVSDPCLFIKNTDSFSVWVVVYVDDLAIVSSDLDQVSAVKRTLASHFSIKDLGEISSFLGIQVRRDTKSRSLVLSQRAYVESVAVQFECEAPKHVSTPLPTGINLTNEEHLSSEPADRAVFQSLLGSLMYLMLATRPDISFAVTFLSQFSSSPTATHMRALRHLLRYTVSTADFSLVYTAGSPAVVVGMTDADFAANAIDRKSINGFVFLLSGAAVTWNAKKQSLIALSTTEAEYVALVHAGREGIWIRSLLSEIGLVPKEATDLYCDNLGAVALTANPGFHARTKHFDIKLHWIRDRIASRELSVRFVPTEHNLADLFTKPLPASRHLALTQAIGLIPA